MGCGIELLVVVVELEEEIVAGLDEGEDLGESLLGDEAADGFSGFGVVGDDDAGGEEAGEHLAPGGPGFDVLIDDGGVSGEVESGFVDGGDGDGTDAGVIAVELEGELGVPVEVADLAGLEADVIGSGELGDAEVGVEGTGDGGSGWGGDFFEHEAAGLGADGGGGGLGAAEDEGDAVAAFGEGDGEVEGLIAGAGVLGDGWEGVEIEAGGGVGEEGGGREGCCGFGGGAAGEGLGERGDGGSEGEEGEGGADHVAPGVDAERNSFNGENSSISDVACWSRMWGRSYVAERGRGLFGEELGAGVEVHAEGEALDDHAEDVFEGEVGLLDVHGDVGRDDDVVVAEGAHGSAAVSGEADGGDALGVGLIDGVDDVGRVAGGGDAEEDVAGLSECFDLAGEDEVEAEVVAGGGEDGGVGGECDGAECGAVDGEADDELCDEVLSIRCGTSVAGDEELIAGGHGTGGEFADGDDGVG